jgi:hypothetical protein
MMMDSTVGQVAEMTTKMTMVPETDLAGQLMRRK